MLSSTSALCGNPALDGLLSVTVATKNLKLLQSIVIWLQHGIRNKYLQNLDHVKDLFGDADDGDMVLLMNMMQKR